MSEADGKAAVEVLLAEGRLGEAAGEDLARLLEAITREYGARWQEGRAGPAFPDGSDVSATDVMVMTTSMLKAVNLQPFELGMWQSWSGQG